MKTPAERKDLGLMRKMFGTIAPRYDFMTRVLSYGMDRRWKRLAVHNAQLPDNAVALDLAAGTGDFSELLLRRLPGARAVAVDLTEPMLQRARARGLRETVCADATALPFADASFDCVFVGYGLRNFPCLETALREIQRVTRPGGMMVTLDFFLPPNKALRQAYLGGLYAQGAFWGLMLHGRPRTYTYIPDSLRSFVSLQQFSALLGEMGYQCVDARSFIFGGIGLHWAVKG
jgi:demethylmenaquinone methyltransferase / 2-methoxy-6-polyprenyl-1,4-benzoquinol methylase